jgi:hypothetical protein
MKKLVLLLPLLTLAGCTKAFTGEVFDSNCAKIGAHETAGYGVTHTHTHHDCTLACVKSGAHFVLFDGKTIIPFENQTLPEAWAGQKVKIVGKVSNSLLEVSTIQAQ